MEATEQFIRGAVIHNGSRGNDVELHSRSMKKAVFRPYHRRFDADCQDKTSAIAFIPKANSFFKSRMKTQGPGLAR